MRAALRVPAMMVWLAILWVLLWGQITWANVLGGVLVAAAVLLLGRLDLSALRSSPLRPHWAVAYFAVIVWKLVLSNLKLAYQILTPGLNIHTGIIAVPMRGGSDAVVNLVANSITLTPGTMTVDVKRWDVDGDGIDDDDHDSVVLYIHGMFTRDVERVRHDVLELEALALRAFGSSSDYERAAQEVTDHEALLASARETTRRNRRRS